jgi:hypothetical protein
MKVPSKFHLYQVLRFLGRHRDEMADGVVNAK